MTVAPAWGRGLKSFAERQQWVIDNSRPRMGAWIEIKNPVASVVGGPGRPRMGAWIEILADTASVFGSLSPPHGGVD